MFGAAAETEGRGSALDCVVVVVVWRDSALQKVWGKIQKMEDSDEQLRWTEIGKGRGVT